MCRAEDRTDVDTENSSKQNVCKGSRKKEVKRWRKRERQKGKEELIEGTGLGLHHPAIDK